VAGLSACKSSSKGTVEIKFNLPKGVKYEYSLNTEMKMKQNLANQETNIKNSIGFTYLYEVINDSADWKTVSATITKMSMDMDAMGRTMHFDTDMPMDSTDPMAMMGKIFGAMKGSQFSFTLNEKGEIGKVSGIKEMQEKMLAGLPNAEQVMEGMKNSFNEESMKENIGQAFAAYPGKPVRPGESWTKSLVQSTQGMKVKSDNTFTLESVNGDDAIIKVVSKLSSDSSAVVNGANISMSGTSDGKMHYDLKTGMTTDGDMDMKMDMKVKAGGQEVPMNMDMKMKIKGKKF
jgi:hypothetical protein